MVIEYQRRAAQHYVDNYMRPKIENQVKYMPHDKNAFNTEIDWWIQGGGSYGIRFTFVDREINMDRQWTWGRDEQR